MKHGWVHIDGAFRPFTEYRTITRGKHKGDLEVIVGGKKLIVSVSQVKRYPKVIDAILQG